MLLYRAQCLSKHPVTEANIQVFIVFLGQKEDLTNYAARGFFIWQNVVMNSEFGDEFLMQLLLLLSYSCCYN